MALAVVLVLWQLCKGLWQALVAELLAELPWVRLLALAVLLLALRAAGCRLLE